MAAACVQDEGTDIPEAEDHAKYISIEELQNHLQLSGNEALTVQVDNESGYIIKCSGTSTEPTTNQIITGSGDSVVVSYALSGSLTQQEGYVVQTCSIEREVSNDGEGAEETCKIVQSQTNNETLQFQSEGDICIKKEIGIEIPENSPKKQCKVEMAVQANDYDIERRSGKVPSRRRMIPFKFRDYKNPELVKEEKSDSDSDYNPDEEVKTKIMTARKSGQTSRRGRPKKAVNTKEMVIVMQSSASGVPTNRMIPVENLTTEIVESPNTTASGKRKEAVELEESVEVQPRVKRPKIVKDFKCETCNKTFSSKGNLRTHEKIHADIKPFKCDIDKCGKAFRSNESLRRHRLSHMGIKPFECYVCKNKFASNVSLQEHLSRHTDERPHQCHICQKSFRQISCFRRHLITHSSDLPFTCHVCGKKFSQNVYLRSHMKVHTGERPFQCDECGKAFAHQSDLARHKIVHSDDKETWNKCTGHNQHEEIAI